MRSRTWILWVTALSLVLGGLLASSLKTQRSLRLRLGVNPGSRGGLVSQLYQQAEVNKDLRSEILALRKKNEDYEERLAGDTSEAQALYNELKDMRFFAGLKPAVGQGIVVTLRDAKPKEQPEGLSDAMIRELEQDCVVHDSDVRDVVNELWVAGAEAIAVNDQRIVARTPIRCVGSPVLVNEVKMMPPIRIKAIGSGKDMLTALRLPNGPLSGELAALGMISAEVQERIVIPAYTGSTRFSYAKAAQEGE